VDADSTTASKIKLGEVVELAASDPYERIIKLLAPHGATRWLEWPKESSSWITCKYGQLNANLLKRGYPFGLIPNKNLTSWFVIDIDNKPNRRSQYHPENDQNALAKIRKILADNGIEGTITLRSSNSGGIHLWTPIPEVSTLELAVWLQQLAREAGLVLAPGTLEIFPNVPKTGSDHQGIRIPLLTQGSFLLDSDTLNPTSSNIELFCDIWERYLGWNQDFALPNQNQAYTGYYRQIPASKERLQRGFTGRGQTYELAGHAAYIAASEGLSGVAIRSRMCALLKQAPNCKALSGHWREIKEGKLDKWWRHYSDKAPKNLARNTLTHDRKNKQKNPLYNQELSDMKRRDLLVAANLLIAQGQKFSTVTQARRAIITEVQRSGGKMSINTVLKHDDLTMALLAVDQDR
jgi:hypothetical protein